MKTFKVSFIFVALIISICLPSSLICQETEEVPPRGGFFMRGLIGGGSGTVDVSEVGLEVSGGTGLFHFSIGGQVAENLVLHGDLGGFNMTDPEAEVGSRTAELTGYTFRSTGIGAGLTYYLMPENVYFSGSLLLDRLVVDDGEDESGSDRGPGIVLSVGKEWEVGTQWSLGVAGFYKGHWVEDEGVDMNSTVFGLAFSATRF